MNLEVTIRTHIEFEDLDDINDAQDIILNEMTADDIISLAHQQCQAINIDVDES